MKMFSECTVHFNIIKDFHIGEVIKSGILTLSYITNGLNGKEISSEHTFSEYPENLTFNVRYENCSVEETIDQLSIINNKYNIKRNMFLH